MISTLFTPRVLFIDPPNQSLPNYAVKPNGSLAYPYLAGALREAGIEVQIYDACVGNDHDDLKQTFYTQTPLPSGLLRTGVSDERILKEIADYDIIGLTSIFTNQEKMVLHVATLVKEAFPEKIVIAGGVNARNRYNIFLASGVDIVFLSEAEQSIVQLVNCLQKGKRNFGEVSGIAYNDNEEIKLSHIRSSEIITNLDELPIPAFDLLPLERYWEIARPHGGSFPIGTPIKYCNIMTSRGCVFNCSFCHIAGETEGSNSGPLGKFRIKSDGRVLRELDIIKNLGVEQLFIEDDTLFGHKERAIRLLKKIRAYGFEIMDVNGINVVHCFDRTKPDQRVLDAMVDAGFSEFTLAFESASQRILSKYVSNKWDVNRYDILSLARELKNRNIRVVGNYMIGYPDETREEILRTIEMAKRHKEAGFTALNFFIVMPLPGTPLFDMAVRDGYFDANFDPDIFHWIKPSMKNTTVSADELEQLRHDAWHELNDDVWIAGKKKEPEEYRLPV